MFTSEEAKKDLRTYHKYMLNTDLYLYQLIEIEEKYGCYGGTPQMTCEAISKYINE